MPEIINLNQAPQVGTSLAKARVLLAVEIAAREGARILWLPTMDAANGARELQHALHRAPLPLWARLQDERRSVDEYGLREQVHAELVNLRL